MDLYESIFQRRSVRSYSEKKIKDELMGKIEDMIEDPDKLYDDIEMNIEVVSERKKIDEVFSGLISKYAQVKSPHYLIVSSEPKNDFMVNIGYTIEDIVLKMTSYEIGTCWIGSGFDENKIKKSFDIDGGTRVKSLLSFGYPKFPKAFEKRDLDEIKRKSLDEIILDGMNDLDEDWKEIMQAVRIAPSAMNAQPWRFKFEGDRVHEFIEVKGSLLERFMKTVSNLKELNRIDAGIALKHLEVAANYFSKSIEFKKMKTDNIDDLEYILTAQEIY